MVFAGVTNLGSAKSTWVAQSQVVRLNRASPWRIIQPGTVESEDLWSLQHNLKRAKGKLRGCIAKTFFEEKNMRDKK